MKMILVFGRKELTIKLAKYSIWFIILCPQTANPQISKFFWSVCNLKFLGVPVRKLQIYKYND
jgi:hypothetical protein